MEDRRHNYPLGDDRNVTLGELDGKLDLVRQEQRTEHVKTRAIVAVTFGASVLKSIPYLAGALGVGFNWPEVVRWIVPF